MKSLKSKEKNYTHALACSPARALARALAQKNVQWIQDIQGIVVYQVAIE